MSIHVPSAITAAVVFLFLSMQARGADKKPLLAEEAAITAVVEHFAGNGVKLQADGRGGWVVVDPKGEGYEVVIHFRSFPAATKEAEMRRALKAVNLAYSLNVASHIAMSRPGLRILDAAKKPPQVEQLPAVIKLEKLFQEYRPPRAADQ